MKTTLEQFEDLLKRPEDIDLEFKTAKNSFDDSHGSLNDYCAAISNGRGGKLILGVSNDKRVHGTTIFQGTHTQQSHKLWEHLKIHIDVEEFFYKENRVLIFHIPKHPAGMRVKSGGKGDKFTYPIRRGESLGEMDDHKTLEILTEAQPDFTSSIVPGLTVEDMDAVAIENLKQKWAKESVRADFLAFNTEKALRNLGLMTAHGITYAGLILAGKAEVITEHLPDAEIIFEWRHDPKQTHDDFRKNWRAPFVNIDDEIWKVINDRNIRIPFQDGFFQREVWAFDEKSIREALHNAVMHRDYSLKGKSIFIKASPQEFFIESPGGLPAGITIENILFEKAWRNRALAEAFEKIGFAERASQGMDDIFEQSIRDGKGFPDLSKSDDRSVQLSIPAQVKDRDFILYLERVISEKQISLSFQEIYELEKIREHQKTSRPEFKDKFLKMGMIESTGKGRGTKYILARRYYETVGKSSKHTRIKGLSREQLKLLIWNHIKEGKSSKREDLTGGFEECKPGDISNILQELRREGKVKFHGSKKSGYWKAV
ncbi:MAG: putative DNA binding domain-containing protein [Deltaproteobacteria bacterium]|nr:putative DNA binding domain-containing protein [Deltaproteobacteria bacterium]